VTAQRLNSCGEAASGAAAMPTADFVAALERLLSELSAVLCDVVVRFEETTSQVTEAIAFSRCEVSRELVVTLQDFDRLRQEYLAVAKVIGRIGTCLERAVAGDVEAEAQCAEAITEVPIAELRKRLMACLAGQAGGPAPSLAGDEAMF